MTGFLALVGGDEFKPGNEEQDSLLVKALPRPGGRAFVIPTAAARFGPDAAVATATAWFSRLGLAVEELRVLTRTHANSAEMVDQAETGDFFYLAGGDPGHTASTLLDSQVWKAIIGRWTGGAVLAGSSAGAMALGEWTLIRDRYPGHVRRIYRPALAVVPGVAVCPHFDTFGNRWVESATERAPRRGVILLGIDERSAVVWDGKSWAARGPGVVTVIEGDSRRVSRSGEAVALPVPAEVS